MYWEKPKLFPLPPSAATELPRSNLTQEQAWPFLLASTAHICFKQGLLSQKQPTLPFFSLFTAFDFFCVFFFFSETVILSGWHLPLPLCLLWKHKPIILPNSPDKKRYSGHIVKLNRYFLIYTDYMEISRFSDIRDEILNNKVVKIAKIETSKPGLGRWFGQ